MESNTITLIIIIFCIIMSAFFSATETAFSSLNRIRIRNMAEKGNKKAQLVMRLSESYDSLLSTILIGNNIVNIGCASLATVMFVKLLGEESGSGVSTLVTTIVVLIFGEVSPKSIAKESPERFAMFSAPLLHVFTVVLTPANFLFRQWKKLLSRIFKASGSQGITQEELLTIVEEARLEGCIDEEEGSLIRSAIGFNELEAADILTPRIDLTGILADTAQEEAAAVFINSGYSRLPVYEGNLDHIVGILYHKDFYNRVYGREGGIMDVVRPALFITKNKNVNDLMQELQKNKLHIAVVMDEFGGTVGIVTLEDILEELVGEIWDEHDEIVQETEKISDTEYLISGRANVKKLFELSHTHPDTEVLTVGGWMMERLGKVPSQGDWFEYEHRKFVVEKMTDKRIEKVRLIFQNQEKDCIKSAGC